jgi:hypothetical protein
MKGYQLQILIGDGASPEVFTPKCLINTRREFNVEATTRDFAVPDCDDPSLPAWITREKDTLSADVSGTGNYHVSNNAEFEAWVVSANPKNCIIRENATGGRQASGAFHLTQLRKSGGEKDLVESEIRLVSTGPVTFGAIPAPP